jgi:acetyltransferase-like isoleucine patch superfamily enzyme
MAYLTNDQLNQMGFRSVGVNVKISDKASIYDAASIEIGDHSRIDDFCVISGTVRIGSYCHITPMCLIAGGEQGIEIADFCTFAYGVKIFSQSDDYSGETMTNSLVPKRFKKEFFSKIIIGTQTIIGAGSTIMPGVVLQEGTAIGAMSLVTRSTKAWGIYKGIPARRQRDRSKNLLLLVDQFLKEQNDSIQ